MRPGPARPMAPRPRAGGGDCPSLCPVSGEAGRGAHEFVLTIVEPVAAGARSDPSMLLGAALVPYAGGVSQD